MLGVFEVGAELLGVWPYYEEEVFSGIAMYNDLSLTSDNIRIAKMSNLEDQADYTRTTYKTARVHGEWHTSFFFDKKTITIEWVLKADSASELENVIKTMKQALFVEQQELRINKSNGDQIRTTASCTGLTFDKQHNTITFLPFTLTFTTISPFFYGISLQTSEFLSQSASFTDSVTNLTGNFKSLPQVLVSFGTGLSWVTTISVVIGDKTITVTDTFVDSDAVLIDCSARDVEINSVGGAEFTGDFGELEIGETPIEVTVNGTWNADIYFIWYPTYV